jgi:hypothetical protein
MNTWLAPLQVAALVIAVFVSVLQPWKKTKTVKS